MPDGLNLPDAPAMQAEAVRLADAAARALDAPKADAAPEVARAAEETRPREAIELYQQYAERLIALRERKNYQAACTYLVKVRALYEKLGEGEIWASYITALREQNRNLRALKEELAKAGL